MAIYGNGYLCSITCRLPKVGERRGEMHIVGWA